MKVMIIDDDPDDAMLLYEVIQAVGPEIKCIIVHNYNAAKKALEENEAPDFIFLDALMYPVGGKETLIFLTSIAKLIDTRIIINSGFLSPAQIDEFNLLGAKGILLKTANYQLMVSSVKNILFYK